jgi:hypothetical protein
MCRMDNLILMESLLLTENDVEGQDRRGTTG